MKPEFPTPAPLPFLSRVREALPGLHQAERRLALFMLDFSGDLASYGAQELARLSGVSKATVSRFVRRIGFETYEEARRAARSERQAATGAVSGEECNSFPRAAPFEQLAALNLREDWGHIAWTFERIDPAALDGLAAAILRARRVWLIGQQIGHGYASLLYWQLNEVAPEIRVIPQAGEPLGAHLMLMHPDDLVICLALPRRRSGIEAALEEVLMIGASCAVISDESMADDPRFAWHFRCRIDNAPLPENPAAVGAVCHQIVTRTTRLAAQNRIERTQRIDEINARIGDI
ncbi:MurR/RpiR family transcriptional regulator [Pseudooceanicola sediminis]|uniref:MurR/RpiR family transcriptional regulator n=1 Tax=Pseudooceanicola sediminis TaxID=2211117 RepID=A0A399J2Z3_9RHOB|nr:MurR/RpiR family transcriptional regulator [Pseudooceanicola sediminis]KAA2315024.1 MurR/RpiR family transcriptional regulator [Puniceibacterium sp. HSS470]RII38839.1 MurR/RpiR family transcriptional regulator [Pseudooceanicola sediminis]